MKGVPLQGPSHDEDLCVRGLRCVTGELLGDVGRDTGVGRRCGGQDRRARGQIRQQGADPPIVGAEIMAPVRYAVRFVDDHQAGVSGQVGEDLVPEGRVVEPFGGHQ